MVSAGTCRKSDGTIGYDSLRVYNPITDPNATPLGYGNRNAQGVQLSAGTDAIRYFISAGRDEELGVFKLPKFEQARYDSVGITPHDWTTRPNARLLNSFRGNISAQVNEKLDATVNFGYTTVDQRTSPESNATVGIGSQAFGGPGYPDNGFLSIVGTPLKGYRAWTPAYAWEERTQQNVNRMILSSNINWRPATWLQTRANVGTDLTDRVDYDLNMNGEGAPIDNVQRNGFAQNARANITNLSADLGATANYNPSKFTWAAFKTTLGTQYNNFRQEQNNASGTTLPPGAVTASSGAVAGSSEATTITKTWGIFVEEQLALRDRMFVTGAVRTDQNSAFGTNFQRVYYPKASLSGRCLTKTSSRVAVSFERSATSAIVSRTARPAFSRARTPRTGRSRRAPRRSREPISRSKPSTRSVTTRSSRSVRPSGKQASIRVSSGAAFSSMSRTTRGSRTTR